MLYIFKVRFEKTLNFSRNLRFSCGVADIIANDQTLLNVEKTLKQVQSG